MMPFVDTKAAVQYTQGKQRREFPMRYKRRTSGRGSNDYFYYFSAIAIIFIIFKIRAKVKRHNAAMNALVAKWMYSEMSKDQKELIFNTVKNILSHGGWHSDRSLNEREFYSFAALAMAENGYYPHPNIWMWQLIRNPFVAIISAEREIIIARHGLMKKGIDVSL